MNLLKFETEIVLEIVLSYPPQKTNMTSAPEWWQRETNSSPFGKPYFSCAMLVSGRVDLQELLFSLRFMMLHSQSLKMSPLKKIPKGQGWTTKPSQEIKPQFTATRPQKTHSPARTPCKEIGESYLGGSMDKNSFHPNKKIIRIIRSRNTCLNDLNQPKLR